MAKWVTFYEDIFNGVSDVEIHKDKETATKYFQTHYRQYFQLSSKIKVELPMTYGFPFRRYYGTSLTKFKKIHKEYFEQEKSNV